MIRSVLRNLSLLCGLFLAAGAHATEADLYCVTGTTSTGALIWTPASGSNPCPTGGSATSPTFVSPAPVTVTDAPVALTAATSNALVAPGNYKYVCFMNIGATNPFTFVAGIAPAVVGQGQAISPAPTAGSQGGGYCFPSPPKNGVQGISTGGTTVIVETAQ